MARIRKRWKKFSLIVIVIAAVAIGYWAGYRSTVAYKTIELPVARGVLWTEVIPVNVETFAQWECARVPDKRNLVTLFSYSVPYDRQFTVTEFGGDGTVYNWVETLLAHQASSYAQLTASELISLTSIVDNLPKDRRGAMATEAGAHATTITWAVYTSEQGCILEPCWENECLPEIEALRNIADQVFERECHGSCVYQVK